MRGMLHASTTRAVCLPIGVLDQERHQAAEAAHRALGHFVIRVRRQAGIVHLFDARMARQKLGHGLAVFVVPLHAQFERFQAALQQIDIVRRVDGAHDAAQLADRLQLFGAADHHAGQQVVVAAEVLRGRVQHVIDARGERPQVVRRGQRGIDQRFDAVPAADVGEAFQIDDAQVRIGRRFADQQLGLRM